MSTIWIAYDLEWVPKPNESHLVLSTVLPPQETITAAIALPFLGDQLILTNLAARGWDIPGGHVEPGEHPEDAMRREVYEVTGARLGQVGVLGYQLIRILAPKPENYRYPYPDSYQVLYWARVASLDDFTATTEARERGLFSPADARHVPWVQLNRALYEAALAAVTAESNLRE